MMKLARPVRPAWWTRSDCIALAVLTAAWGAALAVGSGGSEALGDPIAVDAARVAAVRETIDPNHASAASLRRLPLIGSAKARAIVNFRRAARKAGNHTPFRFREDLTAVEGIGPVILRRAGEAMSLSARPARPLP